MIVRIRTIKPSFFLDDDVAGLQPLTRLLFVGLWCMADVAGRLEDRPRRIKVALLPYDNHDVDGALHDLEAAGFIHRYKAEGKRIIQVINFDKHQRIMGKEAETESNLPPYTGETTGKHPGDNGETLGNAGREGKGKEGNKEGNGGGAGESAPASAVATPSKEPVRCPDTNGQEKPQGDAIPLNGEPSKQTVEPPKKPEPDPIMDIPLPLQTPEFVRVWRQWMTVRRGLKKPKSWATLFNSQLEWLVGFGPQVAAEMLHASIRNGWTGIFPVGVNGKPAANDRQGAHRSDFAKGF